MRIIFLLICALLVIACSATPSLTDPRSKLPVEKPTTPVILAQVKEAATHTHAVLTEPEKGVKPMVQVLTPENVETNKGAILVRIDEADTAVQTIATKVDTAQKSSVEDAHREQAKDEKIANLEKDDPTRRHLEATGFWLLLAGIALVVASFFLGTWIPVGVSHIRALGIAATATGCIALTTGYYIDEIRLAIAIACGAATAVGVVWLALYAWRNRRLAIDTIKSIEQGKASGQIVFTPAAKDPRTSIITAYQADATQKFVQAIAAKTSIPSFSASSGAGSPSVPLTGGTTSFPKANP